MKLISCGECGVVLDQEVLLRGNDNSNYITDEGTIREDNTVYNGEHFVATIKCPVCEHRVATDHIIF